MFAQFYFCWRFLLFVKNVFTWRLLSCLPNWNSRSITAADLTSVTCTFLGMILKDRLVIHRHMPAALLYQPKVAPKFMFPSSLWSPSPSSTNLIPICSESAFCDHSECVLLLWHYASGACPHTWLSFGFCISTWCEWCWSGEGTTPLVAERLTY